MPTDWRKINLIRSKNYDNIPHNVSDLFFSLLCCLTGSLDFVVCDVSDIFALVLVLHQITLSKITLDVCCKHHTHIVMVQMVSVKPVIQEKCGW